MKKRRTKGARKRGSGAPSTTATQDPDSRAGTEIPAMGVLKLATAPDLGPANPAAQATKDFPAGTLAAENFHKKKGQSIRNFVAVALHENDAAVLLECLYTAQLIRARHEAFRTAIIVHKSNAELARRSGVFDSVHELEDDRKLRAAIQQYRPDVVYNPDGEWRNQMATYFSGAGVRLGGTRIRLVSKLLRIYDTGAEKDLARLKKRGLNLSPESLELPGDFELQEDLGLPEQDFVWLSLFDEVKISGRWPIGHAARLGRLLATAGLKVVVPVAPGFDASTAKEIEYLKRNAPEIQVIQDMTPQRRLAGMLAASAVVTPAGPEALLASLAKKPIILLHDMRSFRRGRGLHLVDGASPERFPPRGVEAERLPVMFKTAEALEKHLKPAVAECINACYACEFDSCVEYISPERVHDQLKKTLLPF